MLEQRLNILADELADRGASARGPDDAPVACYDAHVDTERRAQYSSIELLLARSRISPLEADSLGPGGVHMGSGAPPPLRLRRALAYTGGLCAAVAPQCPSFIIACVIPNDKDLWTRL